MIDLSTDYGSLKIKTPVVAGSSGITDNIDSFLQLEQHGAGAVVLKSLFEEEIRSFSRHPVCIFSIPFNITANRIGFFYADFFPVLYFFECPL